MSLTLSTGDSGYFMINGVPCQRGEVVPVFEFELGRLRTDRDYTGYVSFRRSTSVLNVLWGDYHYSSYIDASTGDPFASLNDLRTWIAANCYAGSTSGTSGIAYTKVFSIVAVPAADDEKAAGDTFTDAWLAGKSVTVLIINNVLYTGAQISFNSGTGEIGPDGSSFLVGDKVVIITA